MYEVLNRNFKTKNALLTFVRTIRTKNINKEVTGREFEFMKEFFNNHPDAPFDIRQMFVKRDIQDKNYCFWIMTPQEGLRDISFTLTLRNMKGTDEQIEMGEGVSGVDRLLENMFKPTQTIVAKKKERKMVLKKYVTRKSKPFYDSLEVANILSDSSNTSIGRNSMLEVLRNHDMLDNDNLPIGKLQQLADEGLIEVQETTKKINNVGGFKSFKHTVYSIDVINYLYKEVFYLPGELDMELGVIQMPFGKYKGSYLPVILRDDNYCEWLLEQDWFKEMNADLFAIISAHHKRAG